MKADLGRDLCRGDIVISPWGHVYLITGITHRAERNAYTRNGSSLATAIVDGELIFEALFADKSWWTASAPSWGEWVVI